MTNLCFCGAAAGYPHRDCPFPYFGPDDTPQADRWRMERATLHLPEKEAKMDIEELRQQLAEVLGWSIAADREVERAKG